MASEKDAKRTDMQQAKPNDQDNASQPTTDCPQDHSSSSTPSALPVSSADKQFINLFKIFAAQPPANLPAVKHQFWDTQPVPKLHEDVPSDSVPCSLESSKTVNDVRPQPYQLPSPFFWVSCDVHNEQELRDVYNLLADNYVEDDDCLFRFNYSMEFLLWALTPPGYFPDWHVGVRTDKGKLVAFITGIPCKISIKNEIISLAEINFLCVHKKIRSKRLAPVLIKEVTRRVNLQGIWHAAYTAGVVLTKPVAQCTYFHRSLNIKKLIDVKFTGLTGKMTLTMAQKLYRLPEEPLISGLRPMERKDVKAVMALLHSELAANTDLYPVFSEEEAEHVLLPRANVIVSYVREVEGVVSDFLSFYVLPSSVIGNDKHKLLNAGYCYYYAATTVTLCALMTDALIIAKNHHMDVFNALNLGRNETFLKELKFGQGDGSLRYYLYNYRCPTISPDRVGLVLL